MGGERVKKDLVKDGQRRPSQLRRPFIEISVYSTGLKSDTPHANMDEELLYGDVAFHTSYGRL